MLRIIYPYWPKLRCEQNKGGVNNNKPIYTGALKPVYGEMKGSNREKFKK
jgi:hypothetical protein